MAVTEGTLPVGGTPDFLDTTIVTNSTDVDVHREAVVITDPETLSGRANVKIESDVRDAGLGVHDTGLYTVVEVMREVLSELRVMNFHLSLINDTTISKDDIDDSN